MTTWTEERVAQLRDLIGQGFGYTATAKLMGLTRNQVLGKTHRLGIVYTGGEPLGLPGGWRRHREKRAQAVQEVRDALAAVNSGRRSCQYIAGQPNGAATEFCGAKGFPWCAEHRAIVYTKPAQREAA